MDLHQGCLPGCTDVLVDAAAVCGRRCGVSGAIDRMGKSATADLRGPSAIAPVGCERDGVSSRRASAMTVADCGMRCCNW